MRVSVAYVDPGTTFWQTLEMNDGCTLVEAIHQSGLLKKVSSIDLDKQKVGIFGKVAKLDTELKEGDRVEIYRPITATADDDDES